MHQISDFTALRHADADLDSGRARRKRRKRNSSSRHHGVAAVSDELLVAVATPRKRLSTAATNELLNAEQCFGKFQQAQEFDRVFSESCLCLLDLGECVSKRYMATKTFRRNGVAIRADMISDSVDDGDRKSVV